MARFWFKILFPLRRAYLSCVEKFSNFGHRCLGLDGIARNEISIFLYPHAHFWLLFPTSYTYVPLMKLLYKIGPCRKTFDGKSSVVGRFLTSSQLMEFELFSMTELQDLIYLKGFKFWQESTIQPNVVYVWIIVRERIFNFCWSRFS